MNNKYCLEFFICPIKIVSKFSDYGLLTITLKEFVNMTYIFIHEKWTTKVSDLGLSTYLNRTRKTFIYIKFINLI